MSFNKISPDTYFNNVWTKNPTAVKNNYDPFAIDCTIPPNNQFIRKKLHLCSNSSPSTENFCNGCSPDSNSRLKNTWTYDSFLPKRQENFCNGCSPDSNSRLKDTWSYKSSRPRKEDYCGRCAPENNSSLKNTWSKKTTLHATQENPNDYGHPFDSKEGFCGFYQIGKGVWSDPYYNSCDVNNYKITK